MLIRQYIALFLLTILFTNVNAQSDSIVFVTLVDSPVYVFAKNFNDGISTQKFNKENLQIYQGHSISELLNKESGIFIKQYGSGLLSTITHRGGSASQTAVLWEGMNILNPMLGQSDISLIPVFFIDAAEWQSGGSSALYGNNSIGGSLQLKSESDLNCGLKASLFFQAGSFGELKNQMKIQYGNSKYAGSIRLFYQKAENDFSFKDINAFGFPKPVKKQSHAFSESFGFLQDNKFHLGGPVFLNSKHWFQHSFRQIPPNLLQTVGDNETQRDISSRNIFSLNFIQDRSSWKADFGFIWELLDYQNNAINSKSQVVTTLTRLEHKRYFNDKHISRFGLEHQFQKAYSNYQAFQNQIAVFISHKISLNKFLFNFSFREQLIDNKILLPAIEFNGLYKIINRKHHKVSLQATASHNYRFPTLNDRFWPVGGNPDLKPEYSIAFDTKIRIFNQWSSWLNSSFDLGAYNNFVRNWIQWTPSIYNGIWNPENIALVQSYGPELALQFEVNPVRDLSILLKSQYQMSRARRIKEEDLSLNQKQLIYTPEHSIMASIDICYRRVFTLRYRHNYFSDRYLDNENINSVAAYQIGFIQAEYSLKIKKLEFNLRASVDNVWSEDYQVIANRPMPGRWFSLGMMIRNF